MKLRLAPSGELALESALVSLRDVRPVINQRALAAASVQTTDVEREGGEIVALRLRITHPALGPAIFGIDIRQRDPVTCEIRYWLADWNDARALDSFGICFGAVANLRAYLRHGYFSWDGSYYVDAEDTLLPAEDGAAIGYGMTQLLPHSGGGSVVVGFDRHDRFQHTFAVSRAQIPPSLTVLTLWDRKHIDRGARCDSERLLMFEHDGVEDALRQWAGAVADASPAAPRIPTTPICGWSSWYNLYAAISEENILEHLRGVAEVVHREQLPMRYFQIDDGFTPEMGDWLDVKPQFPRGMPPLLDAIREAGFVPGLWIAPLMVGNRSRLYREHPDWVVRDQKTGDPLAIMTFYGEFRWHKRSEEYYVLDTTHPDAFAYLRQVFRTWRHEWGCEYFKTDFMHFLTVHGPDRALWHSAGMTRIEIWRRTAEMIREEIGDATWLGCGCPLWASVGLVDAIRIGRDVGVVWAGNQSAQSLLRDQATRNFANHILWQADPDCIMLRERFHHLSDIEVRSLAIFAGMAAGVTMTSDALHELGPARLRLWKLVVNPQGAVCRYPLLAAPTEHRDAAVLVQVRTPSTESDIAAVFVFNTGDAEVQRAYPLTTLGLAPRAYVYDWTAQNLWPSEVAEVAVTLAPHDGTLLFVRPVPFEALPDRLP